MKKNHVLNKVTALFSTGLMLSSPFQSYVYASGISKLTAVVYSSAEGAKSTQKVAKSTAGTELSGTKASAQSVSNNQGGADSNKPVSDAYNFKDLSQSVDPRTGSFSIGMIPEKWTVKFHNFLHILKVRDNQGRSEHGFDYKTPLYIL